MKDDEVVLVELHWRNLKYFFAKDCIMGGGGGGGGRHSPSCLLSEL